jgi:Glycine zipper 2TM domain
MKKIFACTALAALIALPMTAAPTDADAASCRSRKVNGTLIGGVGGALLGGAVTHGSTGPVVGGLGGAVLGHEIGRGGCRKRTAYYAPRRASARTEASTPVRKVYYDQYGNVVSSEPVNVRR